MIVPLKWRGSALHLLDQRLLPARRLWVACRTYEEVAAAIRDMVVRGAPAIGVTAGYGLALAGLASRAKDSTRLLADLQPAARLLKASRPTAVNLAWAVDRLLAEAAAWRDQPPREFKASLACAAQALEEEDRAACLALGAFGATLVPARAVILTHCNAGALATAGHGTALGVIRSAVAAGKDVRVLVDETRPYLQGARLTAWELHQDKIPAEIICDNMAGHFLQRGEVDLVVTGADRIAANGDVANKIGTYPLAVVAKENVVPFYVAAPRSTFDPALPDGSHIPIEERAAHEVLYLGGQRLGPAGVGARHPAFDVTPARYISAYITEEGILPGERMRG